jgi:hypothetical protein
VKYVTLDQNHWIYLARAFWGRPHKPKHAAVIEGLRTRIGSEVVLPLSWTHLIEHSRADSPDSRQRLAKVFEIFGRNWFMASWSEIVRAEILRAVGKMFGVAEVPDLPQIFGRGFTFGADSKAQFYGGLSRQPGALVNLLTFPNEGNRAAQNRAIAKLGEKNAAAAETLRRKRKPYSKAMHRRAQFAGYFLQEEANVALALKAYGKSPADLAALGERVLTELWSYVPSLDVDCELTLYRDRQWSRTVQPNDVNDISHLVTAIPYCDVVVVENFWARAIEETGLGKKYGTTVCSDLGQLPEALWC